MATTVLGRKNDYTDLDPIDADELNAGADDLEMVTVALAELLGQTGFLAATDANGSIVPGSLAVDITAVTGAVVGDDAGERRAFKAAATTYDDDGAGLPPSEAAIYVYLLRDGTYTHNLTGTPPADSEVAFTCATDVNDVTSVNNLPAGRTNFGAVLWTNVAQTLAAHLTIADAVNLILGTGTGTKIGTGATQKLGLWGAAPIARPAALTQTYATADGTLGAYTPDNESAAYTGIDNAQPGTVYATLADVQALRVAYENLRAFTEDLAQFTNQIVDNDQLLGLRG